MGRESEIRKFREQRALAENIATARAVFDRFGRPLVEGATVVFKPEIDILFTVSKISPDLSAGAQPGTVKLQMFVELNLIVAVGRALPNFIVGTYPEHMYDQGQANGGGHDLHGSPGPDESGAGDDHPGPGAATSPDPETADDRDPAGTSDEEVPPDDADAGSKGRIILTDPDKE